jgi:hypothetical protein
MTEINARTMTVVRALKHAIVTGTSPGLSVNTHPNAFFLNVIGEVDLLKAAELVIRRLGEHDQAQQKQEADAATRASAVDGH